MKYLTIAFYFFIAALKAQSAEVNLIEIQIVSDSLSMLASTPQLTISLRCKNNSSNNLLLYGFDSNLLSGYVVTHVCENQERVGGGIGIIVYNDKHKLKDAGHLYINDVDDEPMNEKRFKQSMVIGKEIFLKGTKVLKASSLEYIEKQFNFRQFQLSKGTYYLRIIVFAGKSLVNSSVVVGKEQIEKDKKAYNAELFQGCAISNEIIFTVE